MSEENGGKAAGKEMMPQPHGGALQRGGPGRPPGLGRRTRAKLRRIAYENTELIRQAVEGRLLDADGRPIGGVPLSERRAWLELALRYGQEADVSPAWVRKRLEQTLDAVDEICAPEERDALLLRLKAIWGGR